MKKSSQPGDHPCPSEAAFDVIGGRWKGVILYQLFAHGTLRFGELRRLLPARATQQAITNQLRELEADGILRREVHAQVPPKVEYSLTELGETLRPVLHGVCEWGKAYQARAEQQASGMAA